MCRSLKIVIAGVFVFASVAATAGLARADATTAAVCKKTIATQLLKYVQIHLKNHEKCLDKENKGDLLDPPCPDAVANFKIATTNSKVAAKIAAKCTMQDITDNGYRSDCAYEAASTGIEGQCAAKPVTNPTEFAECMKCWKGAEMSEYIGILYPSHVNEICGSALDETSATCSDIDCTTPLPDQRNLGDTSENDCQVGIAKAGIKYLLKRTKFIEKCLLKGGTEASCNADPKLTLNLAKLEVSKTTLIKNKCGNRDPAPSVGFCCQCGTGNACMVESDRSVCAGTSGCTVVDGKTCDGGTLKCTPGPKQITWWGNCPESDTCPGTALASIDDLIDCVDSTADQISDELLCLQFPGHSCPAPDPNPTPTP
jgi:hypothetical protein